MKGYDIYRHLFMCHLASQSPSLSLYGVYRGAQSAMYDLGGTCFVYMFMFCDAGTRPRATLTTHQCVNDRFRYGNTWPSYAGVATCRILTFRVTMFLSTPWG